MEEVPKKIKKTQDLNSNSSPNQTPMVDKLTKLPQSRIKQIMKIDKEVSLVSAEACFLTCRATDMFISVLSYECSKMVEGTKRKTLIKIDFDKVIKHVEKFTFLDGTFFNIHVFL
ncbi:DNA polymerase II subunit 4 [Intoshia linei]|uniref:DNA polymerase II subunit 4 n=1 Tax=Intoshia linei TaxID=1819745 RepID=A0A177B8C7_9BILA|nr:DNA polymerase II subunit 4 [Intoshia linei]